MQMHAGCTDTDVNREKRIENLRKALEGIEYAEQIARILYETLSLGGGISYEKIRELIGGDIDDVILIANEKRLIVPEGRDLSWKSGAVLLRNERYDLPNVIKHAVEIACRTGSWKPDLAISEYFKSIKESMWEKMPGLFAEIKRTATHGRISGREVKLIASRFGLTDREGVLIAELKAAGLISPCVSSSLSLEVKEKDVIYEVHPCL